MKSLSVVVRISLIVAVVAALVAVASGFGYRLRLWGYLAGFKMLLIAAVAAALAVLAALVCVYFAWRSGERGVLFGSAAALVLGLLVVAPMLSWVRTLRSVPYIHDISTDTDNPPAFVVLLNARTDATNSADYGGPEIARLQHAGYPDIKTIELRAPEPKAFAAALETARDLGWVIVDSVPDAGRIEATDRTFWYGFTDDIVIRVAAEADGSRVDIRSVSRVGKSDLGTNARRIRKFMASLSRYMTSASS